MMRRSGHLIAAIMLAPLLSLSTLSPAAATVIPIVFTAPFITPATVTDDGLSVTFSSPADPGAFLLEGPPATFKNLTGFTLFDGGPPFDLTNIDLILSFSAPLTGLSLDFALASGGGALDFATFQGGIGGTVVDSGAAPGAVPAGFNFAEGLLDLGATPFDTVELSTADAPAFAIGNIVATTATPEPSGIALLGTGLLGLVGLVALRQRRTAPAH
jgi:hypothetical protein